MDTPGNHHPIHQALDHVARMCIDENFLEEAERLLVFLEMINISPFTLGLLRVWARSQRGDLRDALRHCNEMLEAYPNAPDVLSLLVVLRYACGDGGWRSVCEQLLEMPQCRPEGRQLAASLLDGSFGRKKPSAAAQAAETASAVATKADSAGQTDSNTFDPAQAAYYLRG
jgi:hypothetical protein